MAQDAFVHLHAHSDFSMLDGHATVKEIVAEVARLGQPAVALADHGNQHGAFALQIEAEKAGIQPIFALEAYMAPSTTNRFSREPTFFGRVAGEARVEGSSDVSGSGAYTHATLIATTHEGLHNLFQFNTRTFTEGWYMKNRGDVELLAEYSKGLVSTTGCPSGEVQTRLRLGQYDQALSFAAQMRDIMGPENYFLELMDHDMSIDLERKVLPDLLRIAKALNLPLLATNDSHYARQQDHESHDHLLAMQTGAFMSDPAQDDGGKRFSFSGQGYFLKSRAQMEKLFPPSDFPGALDNTLLIAERAKDVRFKFDDTLRPSFPVPDGKTVEGYLRDEVYAGAKRRHGEVTPEIEQRIEHELNVIIPKNYSAYFLVVSDFIRWAKSHDIYVGPGRGCLSGDSQILTPTGFVSLRDVKPGDVVFDEKGAQVAIPNKMEYDCDEELVHIKSFYGGDGNKMTADHKVLVSKALRVTNKQKLAQGIRFEKGINKVEWVRADEVEEGDYVVMPRLRFEEAVSGWDVEKTSTSVANHRDGRVSRNSLARETGVDCSVVSKFLRGEDVGDWANELLVYALGDYGLTREDVIETNSPVVSELSTDRISASHDAGVLFGLFMSDGWIRQDERAVVGFAQRRSEDEGFIPGIIKSVLGVEASYLDSNHSDLRQYFVHHKGVHQLFKSLFPDYDFTASTKYIPTEFMNTPEEFRRGLLEGLWYGDGSDSGKTKYSSRSLRLARGVHTLLLSLGLPAGLKSTARCETREGFGPTDSIEYSVTTARYFNVDSASPSAPFRKDENFLYYRVRSVETVPAEGKVYDFTVPTTHSYVTDSSVVHNSAGGCEVAFALDITDLDPIKHDLLFERFLNPERDSPPDIDVDIEDRHRDEVLAYVTNLYGKENVANIVTFTRMGVKTAIKDSAKILEAPYSSGELLNSKIPKADAGHEMTFDDIYNPDSTRYEEAAEFRDLVKTLEMDEVIAVARGVEGRTKTTGVHAAGVLISSKPLADHIPLMMRQKDGLIVTQFDYPTCEALGLIKVDFLGLRNLTVIHDTVRHIKNTRGIDLDATALILGPMDDEKTFELFRAGDTLGVFQLDGGAMRELLRKMKPTSIDDISAVLALYRPGPMGMDSHNEYAARKNGLAPVRDIHPELTQPLIEILGPTYGLCVYQEQVMAIAQKVAGYSLAQADNLRRAMGKKKKSVLDAEYIPFSKGMKDHGYSDEATKTLWDTLVPFAEYGFNKSHSMGYALISYLTAYLKANYPAEYMASLITSVFGKNELIPSYLNECRKMGFPVLPPDVNIAQSHTIPLDASTIMFGMSGVRHVSHDRATMIVEARERGKKFPTITDFFDRMPSEVLNSGVLHGLIHAGSFDSFGYSRRAMALVLPDLASDGRAMKRAEAAGQDSLFSLIDDPDSVPQVVIPDIAEYPKQDLLSLEREALGLYLSDHPLSDMADSLDAYADVSISEILDGSVMAVMGFATKETPRHRIAGVVTSIAKKRTKKGDEFAIVELEDLTGSIEMTIFSRTLNDCKDVLKRDRLLTVRGVPRIREEGSIPTFTVDSADEVEMTPDGRSPYNIRLMPSQTTLEAKLALGAALKRHPGKSPVKVHVKTPEGIKVNELADEFCVAPSRTLMNEIIALFGVESIGKW